MKSSNLTPKISVVYPVFNEAPDRLRNSLNSLKLQTYTDFECIIIDDSTNLLTTEVCKLFADSDERFILVRPEERLGLTKSLNHGISISKANYIARFDSDDVCELNRFELQVAFLDANPDVGILGSNIALMNEDGVNIGCSNYPLEHQDIVIGMQYKVSVAHPSIMYRKSVVVQAGGYNDSFKFSEDLDLWLRLIDMGFLFANLNEQLVRYRVSNKFRPKSHWEGNIRARYLNFSRKFLLHRMAGISLLWIYCLLPDSFRLFIYKHLR